MISKERLEELIEQEETVWCVSELWGSNKLKLHNKDIRDSDCFYISKTLLLSDSIEFYDEEETYRVPFQLLFETQQEYLKHQEEAEWYKEFGCILKIERLWFPTWESVYSDLKDYKDGDFYIIDNDHFSFVYNKGYVSPQLFLYTHNEKFNWNANKENYYQACKLAKKIFLGEIE